MEDYAKNTPSLDLEEFFKGPLSAHGVIKDHNGKVIRTFNAEIDGSWSNGTGTLVEDFVFDNGEIQQRIWTLKPNGAGAYIGTAGDVIGEGSIQISGNSMFLDYVLRIPFRGGTLDLNVDDRMYLVNPTTLINESRLIKYGFSVGEILLVLIKKPLS